MELLPRWGGCQRRAHGEFQRGIRRNHVFQSKAKCWRTFARWLAVWQHERKRLPALWWTPAEWAWGRRSLVGIQTRSLELEGRGCAYLVPLNLERAHNSAALQPASSRRGALGSSGAGEDTHHYTGHQETWQNEENEKPNLQKFDKYKKGSDAEAQVPKVPKAKELRADHFGEQWELWKYLRSQRKSQWHGNWAWR